MAIITMLTEPGKDKLYINLKDGEMEKKAVEAVRKCIEDEEDILAIDADAVMEKVFDAMEEYGVIFEW